MWFICDGLGIALGLVTWLLIAFADAVVVRHVLVAWFWAPSPRVACLPFTDVGLVVFVVYQALLALSWISHVQAMTTDPGTIRQSEAPTGFQNPRSCKLCQGRWKPPRAHHCKTCHRCIFRMDHHCPWINNCVGLSNQKLFILFLGYTGLSAIVTLLLLIGSACYWLWSQNSWSDAAPPGTAALICSGVVAVECLAAVLFVGDFLQEQIESIQTNSTLVETYQRTHGARTTFMDHFQIVFGDNWYQWPWPFVSAPPPNYEDPAIPEDESTCGWDGGSFFPDDGDNLGIAGDDTEERSAAGTSSGARPRQRHGNGAAPLAAEGEKS